MRQTFHDKSSEKHIKWKDTQTLLAKMYEERMSRKRIYNYALAPIIQVQPDRESYQIGNEMFDPVTFVLD